MPRIATLSVARAARGRAERLRIDQVPVRVPAAAGFRHPAPRRLRQRPRRVDLRGLRPGDATRPRATTASTATSAVRARTVARRLPRARGHRRARVVRERRTGAPSSPATRATPRCWRRTSPRAGGFRWEGYSSTELPFDPAVPADRTTRLEPEFALPAGADGAPFAGPFRWRAVVGFRETGAGGEPGRPDRLRPAFGDDGLLRLARGGHRELAVERASAISACSPAAVTRSGQGATAWSSSRSRTSTAAVSALGPSR